MGEKRETGCGWKSAGEKEEENVGGKRREDIRGGREERMVLKERGGRCRWEKGRRRRRRMWVGGSRLLEGREIGSGREKEGRWMREK